MPRRRATLMEEIARVVEPEAKVTVNTVVQAKNALDKAGVNPVGGAMGRVLATLLRPQLQGLEITTVEEEEEEEEEDEMTGYTVEGLEGAGDGSA